MFLQAQLAINATQAAVWADTTDITNFTRVYEPQRNTYELREPKG